MNVKPRSNDHSLTLRLPGELYDQLRARAEEDERTVAWVLRRLARQYVAGETDAEGRNHRDA